MTVKRSSSKQIPSTPHHKPGRIQHKRNLAWIWVGAGALLVVLLGIILIKPGTKPSTAASPSLSTADSVEISPAEAFAKYQQGAFFLDVRSQEEWNQFHVEKSSLIPLDQLQNRLGEIPRDADIVVVCLSGHRALSGTAILQQAGFVHVSCLRGGLQAWKDANYPLIQGIP